MPIIILKLQHTLVRNSVHYNLGCVSVFFLRSLNSRNFFTTHCVILRNRFFLCEKRDRKYIKKKNQPVRVLDDLHRVCAFFVLIARCGSCESTHTHTKKCVLLLFGSIAVQALDGCAICVRVFLSARGRRTFLGYFIKRSSEAHQKLDYFISSGRNSTVCSIKVSKFNVCIFHIYKYSCVCVGFLCDK